MASVNQEEDMKAKGEERKVNYQALYESLGVELGQENGSGQTIGECPFCAKKKKFYLSLEKGTWDCKSCQLAGNEFGLLKALLEASTTATGTTELEELAEERGYGYGNPVEVMRRWGVCKNVLTGEWVIPAWNQKGALVQIYRHTPDDSGKLRLMATAQLGHGIFTSSQGILADPDGHRRYDTVFVTEGVWDGIALELIAECSKWSDEEGKGRRLLPTKFRGRSVLKRCLLAATPGCSIWKPNWNEIIKGKNLTLLFDNDYPREGKNGKRLNPPAYAGLQRISRSASVMAEDTSQRAKEIHYLRWAPDGDEIEDHYPALPDGFDLRDALEGDESEQLGSVNRRDTLKVLLHRIRPIPREWLGDDVDPEIDDDGSKILPVDCASWDELVKTWKDTLKWSKGLDLVLSSMLACVVSTKQLGEPLWLKVIGPPACGKSTLAEAVSVARKYVKANSTMRGFHSGISDSTGTEDNSLLSILNGKCMITKDGDTLLKSPNLQQILSEARDIYDGVSRVHYRNRVQRDYECLRVTWLLLGTSAIRKIDGSELGERFLDVVLTRKIDDEHENQILLQNLENQERLSVLGDTGKSRDSYEPARLLAMQMTGGYIHYLRENILELAKGVRCSDDAKRSIIWLAKFVAYCRSRPSVNQEEVAEREFATRLSGQLYRLALFTAIVMQRKSVDSVILERVRRVALDTAEGIGTDLVRSIYSGRDKGGKTKEQLIGGLPLYKPGNVSRMLKHFTMIGAIRPKRVKEILAENREAEIEGGLKISGKAQRYFLTAPMVKIWESVMKGRKE